MEFLIIGLLGLILIVLIILIVIMRQNDVSKQLYNVAKEQAIAAQNIGQMHQDIGNMAQVMSNTKARGNWGEYQLEALLKIYAGENPNVYTRQLTLNNGKIADAALKVAGSNRWLCIDAKFPMENYLRYQDDPQTRTLRAFKSNMKKHIDDISEKYITIQTVDQALLFLPSEALYVFVCSQCEDLLRYALSKHVLVASPTTLVGIVYTLLASTKDFYRAQNVKEIERDILSLQEDMDRLIVRSEKAQKMLDGLYQQFHQVDVSAKKIHRRMEQMAQPEGEEI